LGLIHHRPLQSTYSMHKLRLFGSHLTAAQRRVYGAVLIFYLLAFAAMVWPVMTLFNRVRPLVLGMPFSLFFIASVVVASFLVQLALFRWEQRQHGSEQHGSEQQSSEPPEDES